MSGDGCFFGSSELDEDDSESNTFFRVLRFSTTRFLPLSWGFLTALPGLGGLGFAFTSLIGFALGIGVYGEFCTELYDDLIVHVFGDCSSIDTLGELEIEVLGELGTELSEEEGTYFRGAATTSTFISFIYKS